MIGFGFGFGFYHYILFMFVPQCQMPFFFYVIYIIYLITWDPSLWANCKCHSNELKWKHKIVLTRPRKLKFIFLPESRDGYISKNLCRYGWVRTSHNTLRSLEFFIFMYFLYVILVVYISVLKLYFYHVLGYACWEIREKIVKIE